MHLLKTLFLACLLAGCASRDNAAQQARSAAPIPLVSNFDPADYRGKVLLLNFWTTWCPPCRMEIPDLVRLHRAFDRDQVAIVGISIDDRGTPEQIQEKLRQAMGQYQIDYPVFFDSKLELYRAYGSFPAIPTTFLFDRQGNLRETYTGARSFEVFAQDIRALLDG